MPTRKIADPPPRPCSDPEHNPPSMRVYRPGTYEHECPRCHQKQVFIIHETWCRTESKHPDKTYVWTMEPLKYGDRVRKRMYEAKGLHL
jgi:hypothetical protein